MSGDLWICRACDLASLAIELRPQRILSIAEPGFRNPTPDGIAPDDHHHLNFDDITEAEINPLIVRPEGEGVVAVDGLIVRRKP